MMFDEEELSRGAIAFFGKAAAIYVLDGKWD